MSPGGIVHIGYHKTGTSWFQDRVYPLARSHQYIPREVTQQALLRPHALEFDAQRAQALLTPSSGLPPLVCEENLSGDWASSGLMGALSNEVAQRLGKR